jgi:hypothetical protein
MHRGVAAALLLGLRLAGVLSEGSEIRSEAGLPGRVFPADVRAALAARSLQVFLDGRLRARFWLARQIRAAGPAAPGSSAVLRERLNFAIAPGALVGALELFAPWSDFRDQTIAPGSYELRYAAQPVMKEHRGVSEFRDFVLLVAPGALRTKTRDPAELQIASRRVSGTAHPAVLALYPVALQEALPRLARRQGGVLVLEVRAGWLSLGLVIEGKRRASEETAAAASLSRSSVMSYRLNIASVSWPVARMAIY